MGVIVFKLASLSAAVCAALLMGCSQGPQVDAHTTAVVVEKIEPGEDEPGLIRAVTVGSPERVVVFSLRADVSRPLSYIWKNLQVGSNVAFVTLDPSGEPRHHPDGIFALNTAEIVLLDKPGDLDAVLKIAKDKRRETLLAEGERRDALNKMWHQVHAPKE